MSEDQPKARRSVELAARRAEVERAPTRIAPTDDPVLELVEAARAGDAEATAKLLAELAPPLLRAVRALLGPQHPDVDDLLQEVLVAIIDALPSFRGESTFLHFAIRIASRKATSTRGRSHAIVAWLERLYRGERALIVGPHSPSEETLADRRRALLRTLLSELPDAQAEALVMRVALGYSLEEIAALTRTPLNTVRSRLRLAKEAARARIASDPRWAELGSELS
jgi:RNA polymerase sigma-70 factor (ECF subfamily)